MRILGISCYYHDSAACLVVDGEIVAAAQEERFTRVKHDASFPSNAIRYCLAEGGVGTGRTVLDRVVFYDKPLLKFHRILETYLAVAPRGLRCSIAALPLWLREKLWIPPRIEESLEECGVAAPQPILFTEHHEAHAASAFYPSPFEEAAVLTLDGVGEWATTTVGVGEGSALEILHQMDFPHSLGLLYSAFTYFCGFRVNSGEYKLMGLAPYGEPRYAGTIRDHLIDLRPDGSFRLNMEYFAYMDRLVMTNERFAGLFGGPPRAPETALGRREMDLARSVQEVTEEVVLALAAHAREASGKRHLVMAGGVALNCVANGKLLRSGLFDDLWIQPAAGDAGGALGAALAVWYRQGGADGGAPRRTPEPGDSMKGALLGPEFSAGQIQEYLHARGYPYEEPPPERWAEAVAELVAAGGVVGLFQGRMELGPRALGCRSILGDARSPRMQSVLNLKIKFRESFRPFAPSVLAERAGDFFDLDRPSPYMLLVADVREERRRPEAPAPAGGSAGGEARPDLREWVNRPRSDVPAVTHVDYSARIQTVHRETNPAYHAILTELERLTGYGILVNTSFNVRGEPIVCTPTDAYRCFMRTGMDHLVLGPFLLHKTDQPEWREAREWRKDLQPD
ncbi:MAG TPA: carbamoyltransferase [Thermoanaerobaculia bacterium]|nr:carbamoyltransferase [Thermoanaerobaculia bacterium]